MSIADDIAQRRSEVAQQKRDNQSQEATKSLVANTQAAAKSGDINAMISQLKEVQLASLLNNSKPTVINIDQSDIGNKISSEITALGQRLDSTIKLLDSGDNDAAELALLKNLKSAVDDLAVALKADTASDEKSAKDLLKAVKAIKVSPVVNVPTPQVTVTAPKVDFSPLQNTIKEYFKPVATDDTEIEDKIDLDSYKAQDIDNTVKDMQYIGFINPAGNWYIIENNIKKNSLRYVFGTADYSAAFAQASSFEYSLLNEAINALSA